jgi:hypothetical protein
LRKRRPVRRQVGAGKANVSEPLRKCRKRIDGIETGVQLLPRDEPEGYLLTALVVPGTRRRELGAGASTERGNPSPCRCRSGVGPAGRREYPKQRKLQGAEYRCGAGGRTVP